MPAKYESFGSFIEDDLVTPMNQSQSEIRKQLKPKGWNKEANFWEGIRQEVELPRGITDSSKES